MMVGINWISRAAAMPRSDSVSTLAKVTSVWSSDAFA